MTPWVDFTKFCAPSKKTPVRSVRQEICHSISPTKFQAKICSKFAKFVCRLPNAVHQKKLLILFAQTNVEEIDPLSLKMQTFECRENVKRGIVYFFFFLLQAQRVVSQTSFKVLSFNSLHSYLTLFLFLLPTISLGIIF